MAHPLVNKQQISSRAFVRKKAVRVSQQLNAGSLTKTRCSQDSHDAAAQSGLFVRPDAFIEKSETGICLPRDRDRVR